MLIENDAPPISGVWAISEYLDETRGFALHDQRLLPSNANQRAEVRRLAEWFLYKFDEEVTGYLVEEKVAKRERAKLGGNGGAPDSSLLRAARANIRTHLHYIEHLISAKNWLAGDRMSYADLAAAAALSVADYLGEVPWQDAADAKDWYMRMKSRPAFRPLQGRSGARAHAAGALRESRLLTPQKLRDLIAALAKEEGFEAIGVTTPDAIPEAAGRLSQAIADGHHGTMTWLADTAKRRGSPSALWPEVRSIVMLGMNYGPERDPLATLADRQAGTISVYARNRDYHDLIKGALKRIASQFAARAGPNGDVGVKVFVDTAPVMEKPLAEAAGLGWQGKHTNLVSRRFGSWLFLGAIFTTAELPPDPPEADHCGNCRACLDVCPTDAFPCALPARRAALHLLPDDRARRPDPARASAFDRKPHLRLRRLPRGLPVEQVRREGAAGEACRARRAERAAARRAGTARRRRFPQALRRLAGETHWAREIHPQRVDCNREFFPSRACGRSRAVA